MTTWLERSRFEFTPSARTVATRPRRSSTGTLPTTGSATVYIKPRTPQLNGKVERSHRTDQQECYQLLSYTGDANLEQRLTEREAFYDYHRTWRLRRKTPYEALPPFLSSSTLLSSRPKVTARFRSPRPWRRRC